MKPRLRCVGGRWWCWLIGTPGEPVAWAMGAGWTPGSAYASWKAKREMR